MVFMWCISSLSHTHVSSENREIRKSWVWTQSLLTFSWNSWRMSVGHVIQIRSLWEKSVLLVLIILFQPPLHRCNAQLRAMKHIVCFLWFRKQKRSNSIFLTMIFSFWKFCGFFFFIRSPAELFRCPAAQKLRHFLRGFICCPYFLSIDHSKGTQSTQVAETTKEVLGVHSRLHKDVISWSQTARRNTYFISCFKQCMFVVVTRKLSWDQEVFLITVYCTYILCDGDSSLLKLAFSKYFLKRMSLCGSVFPTEIKMWRQRSKTFF